MAQSDTSTASPFPQDQTEYETGSRRSQSLYFQKSFLSIVRSAPKEPGWSGWNTGGSFCHSPFHGLPCPDNLLRHQVLPVCNTLSAVLPSQRIFFLPSIQLPKWHITFVISSGITEKRLAPSTWQLLFNPLQAAIRFALCQAQQGQLPQPALVRHMLQTP